MRPWNHKKTTKHKILVPCRELVVPWSLFPMQCKLQSQQNPTLSLVQPLEAKWSTCAWLSGSRLSLPGYTAVEIFFFKWVSECRDVIYGLFHTHGSSYHSSLHLQTSKIAIWKALQPLPPCMVNEGQVAMPPKCNMWLNCCWNVLPLPV